MSSRSIVLSALITLVAGTFAFAATIRSSRAHSILRSDGLGYFLYTRSLVVDQDLNLAEELSTIDAHFNPVATEAVHRFARRLPGNRVELPWPVGIALVMAPFYALGLGVEAAGAWAQGRASDTYGLIPQVFYAIGSLTWGLLGFWLTVACCRLVLRSSVLEWSAPAEGRGEFDARVATLAVVLGGPLVFYVFVQPAMAHAPSFGLVALLTYLWLRLWNQGLTLRGFAALAFLWGLLGIVRYQNLIFGLLPASLLLREISLRRWRFALKGALVGLVTAAIPLGMQFAHLLALRVDAVPLGVIGAYDSAQNPINLTSPNFLNVLFSCQHGAFYWAPVLALGFVGLAVLVRQSRWAVVLLATFLLNTLVIGALEGPGNWSGGHSFGMRYLSECTPFFAIGLSVLLARDSPWISRPIWLFLLGALVAWNLSLLVAFSLRTIDPIECVTFPEMARGILDVLRIRF